MKKAFTLLFVFLLAQLASNAQGFIQIVTYRGAFAPSPSPMWTSGWSEFNPKTKVYTFGALDTVKVSANITSNRTWVASKVYLLQGVIYIQSGVSLTIEPGTIIMGDKSVANSSLIASKGGKLLAEGTESKPIVFTSNQPVGSRNPGDWGGVILLGKASTNRTNGVGNIEGLSPTSDNEYGGGATPDDNDNSGILKYVRIEFGGYVFAPNIEINGLTMGAVGKGTIIDYLQCSFINDDSFEWFGGTVNCSHLVAYKGTDDDFDTDNGYSGNVQFALGIRDPQIFDPTYAAASGASTSEGFESDNDASGTAATPVTKALFTNVTIIGPYRGSLSNSIGLGFRRALRLRRNTQLKVFNSIFMDFPRGLHIDGIGASNTAEANATAGLIKFKNNILSGYETVRVGEVNSGSTFNIRNFIGSNANDTIPGSTSGVTGILVSPYAADDNNSDFRPGVLATTGADFTDPAFTAGLLPVTLTSFYGTNANQNNILYWETATEINNAGFNVQRSIDGISFSSIGFVASKAGNSTVATSYQFTDANAFEGKCYYRLQQVDKDGKISYSAIVELTKNAGKVFAASIYPNPVSDKLNIVIAAPKAQLVTLVINDFYGRTVTSKAATLLAGNNKFEFDVKQLAAGQYIISLLMADGSKTTTQKFIKQ